MRAILVSFTLAAAACSTSVSPTGLPSGGFAETASTRIIPGDPRSLLVTVDVQNASADSRSLVWSVDCAGGGPLIVRVYRGTGGARALVWSSANVPRAIGCPSLLIQRTLMPGDVVSLTSVVPVAAILGDSIAAGQYEIAATPETTPALAAEASAGTVALSNAVVGTPGTNLDGRWTGTTGGVTISLDMRWTADSVTASGTWSASNANTLGCGGGTLRGTGVVTLAAARHGDVFGGGTTFGGWTPPMFGVLVDAQTLSAGFMSIDAGPCYLTLTRQ